MTVRLKVSTAGEPFTAGRRARSGLRQPAPGGGGPEPDRQASSGSGVPDQAQRPAFAEWVGKGLPLCLIGTPEPERRTCRSGSGTAAAEAGYRVRYVLASRLVNELAEAENDRALTKVIARYGRVDLLCLDELGYLQLDRRRRRTAVPGPHRTRREDRDRDRVQRTVQRLAWP